MSSTRHSQDGSFRQERYSSSRSLARGLLGNLVSKRCETVRDPRHRELIYWLHEVSLRDGYVLHRTCNLFPSWPWPSTVEDAESSLERLARELVEMFPDRALERHRRKFYKAFTPFIWKLCLDPATEVRRAATPFFTDLLSAMFEYKERFEEAARTRFAETAITRQVFELLDYALAQRAMVLIEGDYRTGKSLAAQAWAQMHLGCCRYVQLSSAGDDTGFYRDIARALGVACSTQMKAAELRNRVEEVLRSQQILLLIDECTFLLPQAIRLKAAPSRMNWLMTSILNNGAAVALIGPRDFSRAVAHVERRCPIWGAAQFWGRVKARRSLPDSLEASDLEAIAGLLLANGDQAARLLLVSHALRSEGYVAALESGALRARFFAEQESRSVGYADVQRMMKEAGTHQAPKSVVPAAPKPLAPRAANRSRPPRGTPASDRQPVGALAGVTDFTGTRPPGLLP